MPLTQPACSRVSVFLPAKSGPELWRLFQLRDDPRPAAHLSHGKPQIEVRPGLMPERRHG